MTIPTDPTWAEVILQAIDSALLNLHTGLPAKVISYDSSKQSAEVAPLLKRAFEDPLDPTATTVRTVPVISNVPVVFPAGGGWSLTFDLSPGDIVHLAFAERSLDRWLEAPSGQAVDPVSARRFDLSDAVAIPGLRPRSAPLAGAGRPGMRLGKDDGSAEVQINADGSVLIKSPRVLLAGEAGLPVSRQGDTVQITDPVFLAWLTAVSAVAGPGPTGSPIGVPFGQLTGVITSGSGKVSSE
jgi:hypothetical protein